MKSFIKFFSLSILVVSINSLHAQTKNPLQECWNKEVKTLGSNYLQLTFTEKRSELENTFNPWQALPYRGKGTLWCSNETFMKEDSILTGQKNHRSRVLFSSGNLLKQDYDARTLSPITKNEEATYLMQTMRFTPIMLIDYMKKANVQPDKSSNNFYSLYKSTIAQQVVSLYVRNSDNVAYQATILKNDDLFGDVTTTILYNDFLEKDGVAYPSNIKIMKVGGHVNDEVNIQSASLESNVQQLLRKPTNQVYEEDEQMVPDINVESYSDNIHFVHLNHTGERSMIVEFSNYLVVIDAPLSSANGELIIKEAKKIAPNKPIKYFSFGHHHPEYIGGLRAFVHEGANIICTANNREYVKFIAANPHTLSNDALQKEPKKLEIDTLVNNTKTISDGKYEMNIFLLGVKSHHTGDFLIYYFPKEKMLFQDDLILMRKTGDVLKAGPKQAALYNAIKELKLDVTTIVQSSNMNNKDNKVVIPFADLETSLK